MKFKFYFENNTKVLGAVKEILLEVTQRVGIKLKIEFKLHLAVLDPE